MLSLLIHEHGIFPFSRFSLSFHQCFVNFCMQIKYIYFIYFFVKNAFYFYLFYLFIYFLLYNIVLVLPYINMNFKVYTLVIHFHWSNGKWHCVLILVSIFSLLV